MRRFWGPLLVLGAAGFDPVGAFTFVGAAALGAVKRNLLVLALTSLLTTWVLTIAAVLGLGDVIHALLSHITVHPTHDQKTAAYLVGGLLLLGWGTARLVRTLGERSASPETGGAHAASAHREGRTPRSLNASGMASAGFLVGLTTLIDPAWYAMVGFASTLRNPATAMLAGTIWTLMSHSLLVVLTIALLLGWYEPVHRFLDLLQTRYRREVSLLITGLLLASGLTGVVIAMLRLFHVVAVHPHH